MATITNPIVQSAIIQAALAKGALVDRDTLDQLEGEKLPVDATVRVQGELSIGKSTMTTQVNKLCPYKLLLCALNKLNGQSIAKLVEEAQGLDDKATKPLKAEVQAASEKLLGTVRQRRSAPLKFNGAVEVL